MYLTPRNKTHTFKESKNGAVFCFVFEIKMSFNIIFKTLAGRNVQPGFEWSLFLSLLLNKFNYTNFKDTCVFAQQSLYASHVNFPIVSE